MDLKKLTTFIHVAELENLSKAAQRLNLTQPALSRQIRLLEEELGCRLLDRTGRGVKLTEAGAILLRRSRPILNELNQIPEELGQHQSQVSGHLCIGLPPTVGLGLTAPIVERYRKAYPAVRLNIVEDLTGTLQEGILNHRIDLAIIFNGNLSANLKKESLAQEELYLVGAADDALDLGQPIAFDEVSKLPLILPTLRHGLRSILEDYALQHKRLLRVEVEADSLRVQVDLVRRRLGYTLLPLDAVRHRLLEGSLSAAPIIDPTPIRHRLLVWSTDKGLSRPAQAMAEIIRSFHHNQQIPPVNF